MLDVYVVHLACTRDLHFLYIPIFGGVSLHLYIFYDTS